MSNLRVNRNGGYASYIEEECTFCGARFYRTSEWALKVKIPKKIRRKGHVDVCHYYFCKPSCLMHHQEPIIEAERLKREAEDARFWEKQDRIEYERELAEERRHVRKAVS